MAMPLKILLLMSLISFVSMAEEAMPLKTKRELKRYYRCYSHMVRERPTEDDIRVKRIKEGKIEGTDACMQVFDQAQLNETTWTVSTSAEADAIDAQAFGSTLHDLTKRRCVSCHGSGAPRPRHASSDVNEAYNVVKSRNLVNFNNISGSTIVQKIRGGHNCWSNCASNAQEIEEKISAWKSLSKDLIEEDLYSDGSGYNVLGKKVLKTFNDYHRTWFGSFNLNASQLCAPGTSDVFDGGEMAYYITRSMFSSEDFKNLVTSDDSLMGIRHSDFDRTNRLLISTGQTRKLIYGVAKRDADNKVLPQATRYEIWNPELIELGELVGIGVKDSEDSTGVWNHSGNVTSSFNLHENQGAGAVTSVPYLLHNVGVNSGSKSDGGMHVIRRWSRSVFNDLFCRDVPVVRNTDAVKYVDMQDTSDLSFRKGISCMQCHSSMDQLARAARGVTVNRSAPSCNNTEGHAVNYVHNFHGSMPDHPDEFDSWVDQADKDFFKRPHNGKFYYRTTDGELVDRQFEGLDEMGNILASQDDLYRCAAKRYLRFFTGVNIPLFDKGDINSPSISAKDREYLEYINNLGDKLKKSQNLRDVVRDIISSEAYLNPGGRVK